MLLQGTTIVQVANWMRVLGATAAREPRYPIEFTPTEGIRNELVEIAVRPESHSVGKRIVELELPKDALIVLISRAEQFIVPGGSTEILAGDTLLILGDNEAVSQVKARIG